MFNPKGARIYDKIQIIWGGTKYFTTKFTFLHKKKSRKVYLADGKVESIPLTKLNPYCGLLTATFETVDVEWDEIPFRNDSFCKSYADNILLWLNEVLPNDFIEKAKARCWTISGDGGPLIKCEVTIRFKNDRKRRESFTDAAMQLSVNFIRQIGLFPREIRGLIPKRETIAIDKQGNTQSWGEYLERKWGFKIPD